MQIDYSAEFKDYWNQKCKYASYENKEDLKKHLKSIMASSKSIEDIDQSVIAAKSRKETLKNIIMGFYAFLETKYSYSIDTALSKVAIFDNILERRLEIAKYLHEKRSIAEIEEHFCIGEKARKKDLRALEEGITFLGSTIKIEKSRKKGKYYYQCTMHPIFLPLNLTEVYALTVYLENLAKKDNVNREMLEGLSSRVSSQLTDYAYEKIYHQKKTSGINNNYIPDKNYVESGNNLVMFLMKSGKTFEFFCNGNKYCGVVKYDFNRKEYYIELTNGQKTDFKLDEIDFIMESINYE